jgi:hypothetical protein
VVDIAAVRVVMVEDGLPGRDERLVVLCPPDQATRTPRKYFRSNAPKHTAWKALARMTV